VVKLTAMACPDTQDTMAYPDTLDTVACPGGLYTIFTLFTRGFLSVWWDP